MIGLAKLTKRYLIAAAAHNLGRILRKLFGVGKPKSLQSPGRLAAIVYLIVTHVVRLLTVALRQESRRMPNSSALAA